MSTLGRLTAIHLVVVSIAGCSGDAGPIASSQDPNATRPGSDGKPSDDGSCDAKKPGRPDAGEKDARDAMPPSDSGVPQPVPCTFPPLQPDAEIVAGHCFPLSPFAWVGPGRLLTAGAMADLPACSGMMPQEFGTGSIPGDQPSACQACTCGSPEGLRCGLGTAVDSYFDTNCVDPCTRSCADCNSSCVPAQVTCAFHGIFAEHILLKRAQLAAGSCSPSAPPAPPPVVLDQVARACVDGLSPTGVSCPPGESCVSSKGQGKICLFHRGDDLACPRGPYTERSVFFSRISDTRACQSCSCGAPTGVDCPSRLQLFETPVCTGAKGETIDTDTECLHIVPLQNLGGTGFTFLPADPVGKGSCPAGGTATGSVSGSDPFTACCIPDDSATF